MAGVYYRDWEEYLALFIVLWVQISRQDYFFPHCLQNPLNCVTLISSTVISTVNAVNLLSLHGCSPTCHARYVFSGWFARTECTQSESKELNCIFPSSKAFSLLKSSIKILDYLLVTPLSITRTFSPVLMIVSRYTPLGHV